MALVDERLVDRAEPHLTKEVVADHIVVVYVDLNHVVERLNQERKLFEPLRIQSRVDHLQTGLVYI